MFGSKSFFFFKEKETLDRKRAQLLFLLTEIWQRDVKIVDFYLAAFDYFVLNPGSFDGATIVKDLEILPGLDIHAMIHDYIYIKYKVAVSIKQKWNADMIYALEMERMGGSAYSTWSRFVTLTIFGDLFFTPYRILAGTKITDYEKTEFGKIFEIFK